MIEVAAGFVAWLGASMVVLADARRGLALGIAIATLGLAVLVLQDAGPLEAAAMALGGLLASARCASSGLAGWQIMPPGSTPRFVVCVAVGVLGLWIAFSVTAGEGAPLRFAVLTVTGLAGARVLSGADSPALLTSVVLLALAIGAAAGLGDTPSGPWPYVAAGAVAAGACWIPVRVARAA